MDGATFSVLCLMIAVFLRFKTKFIPSFFLKKKVFIKFQLCVHLLGQIKFKISKKVVLSSLWTKNLLTVCKSLYFNVEKFDCFDCLFDLLTLTCFDLENFKFFDVRSVKLA